MGGSGSARFSTLYGGSGLSREAGLAARSGSVGGPGLIGETELVGGLGLERGIGWVGRSGSVGGSRLFVGSGFSGEAGLVGGSVLEEEIEQVGGPGLAGFSRLYGGSDLSGEAVLVGGLELEGGAVMLVWEFRRSMAVLRAALSAERSQVRRSGLDLMQFSYNLLKTSMAKGSFHLIACRNCIVRDRMTLLGSRSRT